MKNLKTLESISSLLGYREFGMRRDNCDRCGAPTKVTTMSMFNEDVICMKCKDEERKDPEYKAAEEAEREALSRGERNFKGVMPNYKPLKR